MNGDEFLEFLTELEAMDTDDDRYRAIFKVADDIFREEMSKRNNEDYEVDPEMMGHFTDFAGFMSKFAKEHDGRCEIEFDEPKMGGASVTAYCTLFYFLPNEVPGFCAYLAWAASFSIDALLDGTVCFSVRFTDLYRKKTET